MHFVISCNWNLEMLVVMEGGKLENIEQGQELTTNSTRIWHRDRESNPGHIGGRRVFFFISAQVCPKYFSITRNITGRMTLFWATNVECIQVLFCIIFTSCVYMYNAWLNLHIMSYSFYIIVHQILRGNKSACLGLLDAIQEFSWTLRSWWCFSPCQVTVPKDLVALMSAVGTGSNIHPQHPDKKVYTFSQKVILCMTFCCSMGKFIF